MVAQPDLLKLGLRSGQIFDCLNVGFHTEGTGGRLQAVGPCENYVRNCDTPAHVYARFPGVFLSARISSRPSATKVDTPTPSSSAFSLARFSKSGGRVNVTRLNFSPCAFGGRPVLAIRLNTIQQISDAHRKKILPICIESPCPDMSSDAHCKSMKIGYARVSTQDQDCAMQVSALKAAGCERVYVEQASGGKWERVELQRMLDQLRPGDSIVVWKLDRLSRSLKDLLTILEKFERQGVGFVSVTEQLDTTSAAGRAMMRMVGVFAEFERDLIRERTKAGLLQSRKAGRVGGRPPRLTPEQKVEAVRMVQAGRSKADVARMFRVHPSIISRLPVS